MGNIDKECVEIIRYQDFAHGFSHLHLPPVPRAQPSADEGLGLPKTPVHISCSQGRGPQTKKK